VLRVADGCADDVGERSARGQLMSTRAMSSEPATSTAGERSDRRRAAPTAGTDRRSTSVVERTSRGSGDGGGGHSSTARARPLLA